MASSDMRSRLLLTNFEHYTIQSASMALSGSDCAGGNHFSFLTLIQNSTNVTFCGSRPKGVLHRHSHSLIMAEKLPREPMRQCNFCPVQTNNNPITKSSPRTACIRTWSQHIRSLYTCMSYLTIFPSFYEPRCR